MLLASCSTLNPLDDLTSNGRPVESASDGGANAGGEDGADGAADANGVDANGPWCTAAANTLFVHAALGNDANDGSCDRPFKSVTRALAHAEMSVVPVGVIRGGRRDRRRSTHLRAVHDWRSVPFDSADRRTSASWRRKRTNDDTRKRSLGR